MHKGALVALLAIALAACGARVPTSGVEAGGRGRYSTVAITPLLADDIRVGSAGSSEATRVAAGWNTRDKAARIAAELLEPVGTTVTPVDIAGLTAGDARQLGEGLRAANRLPGGGVVLALRQNAIDSRGRQYSPAVDFLLTGFLGLAVGAATHEDRYQPSFFLVSGDAFEPTRCAIGFDASLIDGRSGAVFAEARGILGLEKMPDSFRPTSWAATSDQDRRSAETYCIAALRRGISQAVKELNLISR